jgi:argininosuccinate lyase
MSTEKTADKRKSFDEDPDNLSAQEKLLTSIDQLSQVLDILGKLVHRIRYQVEAIPTSTDAGDKTTFSTTDQKSTKKDSLIH